MWCFSNRFLAFMNDALEIILDAFPGVLSNSLGDGSRDS